MKPWERLGQATAPDGKTLELRRRGHEYRIWAGGHELMSNEDEPSSRSLAELGCAHLAGVAGARVIVGGLGMGFTLRAALDAADLASVVVAELVPEVVEWNRGPLGKLAGHPLDDARTELYVGSVRDLIIQGDRNNDAILLDVDNGPNALAHAANTKLYGPKGIAQAFAALKPGGVLAVWSLLDDPRFTKRLREQGFVAEARPVFGSRKGRGRQHVIWVAQRPTAS